MPKEVAQSPENPVSTTSEPVIEDGVSGPAPAPAASFASPRDPSVQRAFNSIVTLPNRQARQQAFSGLQRSYGNRFASTLARSFEPAPDPAPMRSISPEDPRSYTFSSGQSLLLKPALQALHQPGPAAARLTVQRRIDMELKENKKSKVAKQINDLIVDYDDISSAFDREVKAEVYKDNNARLREAILDQLAMLSEIISLINVKKWDLGRSESVVALSKKVQSEQEKLTAMLPDQQIDMSEMEGEPEAEGDFVGGASDEVDDYAEYKEKSKGNIKRIKHKATAAKARLYKLAGKEYKPDASSHPEFQGLLASQGPGLEVKGEHGGVRKGAGALAKLALGNFIEAAASGKKAYELGKIKDTLEGPAWQEFGDDVDDLMSMVNSLKGAFKRQTIWELTVGSVKQGISLGVAALTGAPAAGDLIGASASQIGTFAGSSAASAAGGKAGEKAAPDQRVIGGGAKKLNEDEWGDLLVWSLNHQDPRVRDFAERIISGIFLEKAKGNELVTLARSNPYEAAKLIFARQQGAEYFKKAVARYRKAKKLSEGWLNESN